MARSGKLNYLSSTVNIYNTYNCKSVLCFIISISSQNRYLNQRYAYFNKSH